MAIDVVVFVLVFGFGAVVTAMAFEGLLCWANVIQLVDCSRCERLATMPTTPQSPPLCLRCPMHSWLERHHMSGVHIGHHA
jgi:hypothetical protein